MSAYCLAVPGARSYLAERPVLATGISDPRAGLQPRLSRGTGCKGALMVGDRDLELRRLREAAGLPGTMSRQQVLNWIAFRQVSDADLAGRSEFTAKWHEPSLDGRESGLLNALRAEAGGTAFWTPPALPPGTENWPDWMRASALAIPDSYVEVQRAALALIQATGRSAADLASEAQADLDAHTERREMFVAATEALSFAEADRTVEALGTPSRHNYRAVDIIRLWPKLDKLASRKRRENRKHDWSNAERIVQERFDADGQPDWEHERGKKAFFERLIAEQFGEDQPSSSQVRTFLNEQIDAHRKRVG